MHPISRLRAAPTQPSLTTGILPLTSGEASQLQRLFYSTTISAPHAVELIKTTEHPDTHKLPRSQANLDLLDMKYYTNELHASGLLSHPRQPSLMFLGRHCYKELGLAAQTSFKLQATTNCSISWRYGIRRMDHA